NDVACIRWNLGRDKYDVEHRYGRGDRLWSASNDEIGDMLRAGDLEHARDLVERAAGGHHVVDDDQAHSVQVAADRECTAYVAPAFVARQRSLRGSMTNPHQRGAVERQTEAACRGSADFVRLVESTLSETLEGQWSRNKKRRRTCGQARTLGEQFT